MFSGRIASSGCVTAGRDASTSNNTSFDKVAAQSARWLQRSRAALTLIPSFNIRAGCQHSKGGTELKVVSPYLQSVSIFWKLLKLSENVKHQDAGTGKIILTRAVRTTCIGSLVTIIHIILNRTVRAATSSTARRGRGGEKHQTPFKKHTIY